MERHFTSNPPDETEALRSKQSRKKAIALSIGIVSIVIAVVGISLYGMIDNKEAELKTTLEKRLELLATGKTEVISTWLGGLVSQGDRIVQSELFRLFATDVDLLGEDLSLLVTGQLRQLKTEAAEKSPLTAQLPMMQQLLDEFTRYSGFASGRIYNRSGQAYISTDIGSTPVTPTYREHLKTALSTNRPYFTPAVHTENGLIMELFLPITSPQSDQAVAVLMLGKAVSDKINALLTTTALMSEGERTRLIQRDGNGFQEIIPWLPKEMNRLPENHEFRLKSDQLPFAVRQARTDSKTAYSYGKKVPGLDWWIIQESDYLIARKSLNNFIRMSVGIAALMVLICTTLLGAIWWRLIGMENRRSAQRFKRLADAIEKQRRLLNSINNTITTITLLRITITTTTSIKITINTSQIPRRETPITTSETT